MPSGKPPVQVPRTPGGPVRHLPARPAGRQHPGGQHLDPTTAYPFGHGLSYTTFAYDALTLSAATVPTDGEVDISCLVRNTGDRPRAEVVQLYTADPIARLPRPVTQLTGFTRVRLDLHRIVEPGDITVMLGASGTDIRLTGTLHLTGPVRGAGHDRVLHTPAHTD